jgi:hypothetical protein
MDDILSYLLVGTIGLGATTIASAVVGDPLPVVLPAMLAVLGVAGHYHQHRDADDDEADAGQAEVSAAVEDVEQGQGGAA